ncbi:uncharacterized protein KY384_006786 [Bacidia gigantensis]|uniref:uncharacterized protein n=1 Tax=Bacidia gigantensis TaxID=2732470 RepID=UPI001D046FB2|nr:uncharacterized protein KY384_006786 [Bacidia gigantensis]KAG8527870.1 hypothetical protein KY384_006786 [Bacidia gigantensis]
MTGFNGPRGDELSHFLANGNAIASPSDAASQPEFDFAASLEQFTNAQFTEFDPTAWIANEDQPGYGRGQGEPSKRQKVDGARKNKGLDFGNGFPFPENPFDVNAAPADVPPQTFIPTSAGLNNLGTAYQAVNFPPDNASSPVSPQQSPFPTADTLATGAVQEDNPVARAVAEEDKRRRNTAASARFRVKKKEREKAVEKEATDLKKKNQELTSKVEQLERENEWLRSFVVVRDGRKVKAEKDDERSSKEAKKGVGTEGKSNAEEKE